MLLSEVAIVFPVLLFEEDEDDYRHEPNIEELTWQWGAGEPSLVGSEIVDSVGQRFLVRAIASRERIAHERPGPAWMRWLRRWFSETPLHVYDFELKPLPPAPFEETLRRVMEKERAQEAQWLGKGGGPDGAQAGRRLDRCRSIADIIALEDPSYEPPGSASEAAVSLDPGGILASRAPINFPALLFYEDGDYSDAVPEPDNLRYERGVRMNHVVNRELFDSAGQRFRVRRFLDIEERPDLRRKRKWLDFYDNGAVYHFDLELEPLPPAPFEEAHRRILAIEAALDSQPHRQGRRARSAADKQRLEQCRSIGEIISVLGLEAIGAPPVRPS